MSYFVIACFIVTIVFSVATVVLSQRTINRLRRENDELSRVLHDLALVREYDTRDE